MARATIKPVAAKILSGVISSAPGTGLERAMEAVLGRLSAGGVLRPGLIAFRTGAGPDSGFALRTDASGTTIVRGPVRGEPLIEVIGDPDRIGAILTGRRDARTTFLLGGMRVRGDMAYLSELGMKLGFLDRPIL